MGTRKIARKSTDVRAPALRESVHLMRGVLLPLVSHFIQLVELHSAPPVPRPETPATLIIVSTTVVVEQPSEKVS